LSLSPDGKQVAFLAATHQPVNSYTEPDLWVARSLARTPKPRNLTADFDFDIDGFIIGDSASPRAGGLNKPIWTADGKGLIEIFSKEGKRNPLLFDVATGGATDVTSGNQGVMAFARRPTFEVDLQHSTPTRVNDIFVLDAQRLVRRQTIDTRQR